MIHNAPTLSRHDFQEIARQNLIDQRSGRWFQRAGSVVADSTDEDSRSIAAVIATERPVPVYDRRSDRILNEVLLMSGGIFPTWAPLLESHLRYSLDNVLGSVLETRRSGRVSRGRLEFSDDAYTEPIWRKVRAGHLRAVSVGGARQRYVDIEPGESATIAGRRWTAGRETALRVTTRWVMREASIVIFGADVDATTT